MSPKHDYARAPSSPSTADLLAFPDGTPPANSSPSTLTRDRRAEVAQAFRDSLNAGNSSTLSVLNPFATPAPSIRERSSNIIPDLATWGTDLTPSYREADDYLHDPEAPPPEAKIHKKRGIGIDFRGLANIGSLFILCIGLLALFIGYPMIYQLTRRQLETRGGYNIGGINGTGQVPVMPGNFGLIDPDTPAEARHKVSWHDGKEWDLVFSDEFNVEGRTFYPGDDPYWEAVDLHYWGTNNLEWYDPEAVTTEGGSLKITLSRKATHGVNYQGGMVQTWNKFCFTGGLVETSVSLPGRSDIYGLWPAVWAMGNLGRAGYGASLDGMWPYSYDSCDVGTAPNQTINGLPLAALTDGDPANNNELSYLPGQRLSACTCPGESHPGPRRPDGSFKGRGAPEIDVFEAQVSEDTLIGHVSLSAQFAPFNAHYEWFNETGMIIDDPSISELNTYVGGVFQQTTSVVSVTNQNCYTEMSGCFSVYGFEYKAGLDGYITWINDNKRAWTLLSSGLAADPRVEIGQRPIPEEPMYLIANLGISRNFGAVDLVNLNFPSIMLVDWIRVYQPKDAYNVGCDPSDFPTAAYIEQYIEAYTNPNLTTWVDDYQQTFPKNRLIDTC